MVGASRFEPPSSWSRTNDINPIAFGIRTFWLDFTGRTSGRRGKEPFLRGTENFLSTANCSEEERKKNGSASPEQCVRSFLEEVEQEIRRLQHDKSIESERTRLETLRQYVPDSPQPHRLLRYEASLERSFDRTLTQLERLQRMRLGQLVPPPLKVDIS